MKHITHRLLEDVSKLQLNFTENLIFIWIFFYLLYKINNVSIINLHKLH